MPIRNGNEAIASYFASDILFFGDAVLDKTELTQVDRKVFSDYARQTCDGYCIACGLCNGVADGISDTMRFLMYNNWYGEKQMARELFRQMPAEQRQRMLSADLTRAEKLCPRGLAIRNLVAEAARTFEVASV